MKRTGKRDKKHDDRVDKVKFLLEKEFMKHSAGLKTVLKTNDNSGEGSDISDTNHPTPYTPYTITANDSTTQISTHFSLIDHKPESDNENPDPNSSQDTDIKTDLDTKQSALNKRYVQLLFDSWTVFKPEWEKQVDKIVKEMLKKNFTDTDEFKLSQFNITGLTIDGGNPPKQKMIFPIFGFIFGNIARIVGQQIIRNVVQTAARNVFKNVAENVVKEAGKKIIKDAGKKIIKDTGKKIVKDKGKKIVKDKGKKIKPTKPNKKVTKKPKKKKRKSEESNDISMPDQLDSSDKQESPDEVESPDEEDSQDSAEANSQEMDNPDSLDSGSQNIPDSRETGQINLALDPEHIKLVTNDDLKLNSKGLFAHLGPMFEGKSRASQEITIGPDESQDTNLAVDKLKVRPPRPSTRPRRPSTKPLSRPPSSRPTETQKPSTKSTVKEPKTEINANVDVTVNNEKKQKNDSKEEKLNKFINNKSNSDNEHDTQDTGENQEHLITQPWLPQASQDTSVETPGSNQDIKLEINDKGLFEQLGPMFRDNSEQQSQEIINKSVDSPFIHKLNKWKHAKTKKPTKKKHTKKPATKKPTTKKPATKKRTTKKPTTKKHTTKKPSPKKTSTKNPNTKKTTTKKTVPTTSITTEPATSSTMTKNTEQTTFLTTEPATSSTTTKNTEPSTPKTKELSTTSTEKETEKGSKYDVNVNVDHTINIVHATTNQDDSKEQNINSDNKHNSQDTETSEENNKSLMTPPWLPQKPQDTGDSSENQPSVTPPWLPQKPQDISVEIPGSKLNLNLEINDKGLFEQLGPMFGDNSDKQNQEITNGSNEYQDYDAAEEKLKKWNIKKPKPKPPKTKTPKTKTPKTKKPKTKPTTPTTTEPFTTSTEKETEKENSGSNEDIQRENPNEQRKLRKKIAINKKQLRLRLHSKGVFRNGTSGYSSNNKKVDYVPSYSEKSDRNKKSQESSDDDGNVDINLKELDSSSYDELVNKYDKDEYQADCPKKCPIRNVPVCAKCKDGIYRTFLSVCHMRAFNCKHPEEELELVSRYSCVLSAPYYNDGLPIQGIVAEPNDEDPVLKFMKLRSDHEAKKNNPFVEHGHSLKFHQLNIY